MSIKQLTLILLLLITASSVTLGQNNEPKAKLYAKAEGDSIVLRWIVTDFKTWKNAITNGYDIYRTDLGTGQTKMINDSSVRALTPIEWAFRNTDFTGEVGKLKENIDSSSVVALAYQFPDSTGLKFEMPKDKQNIDFGDSPEEIMHLFHTITCLYSKEACFVSGMTFSDTKLKENTNYKYTLCERGVSIKSPLSTASINSSSEYPQLRLKISKDRTNKKQSFLFWYKADTLNAVAAAYLVFRSDKINGEYKKMSSPPVLGILNPYEDRKEPLVFIDNSLENRKTYFYKIQAIDVFGNFSGLSEAYSVTEHTRLSSTPVFKSTETSADFKNTLNWEIKNKDAKNISALFVYRNQNAPFDFKDISGELPPETRSFFDSKPINSNYYKVMAIGNAGDTVWSALKFVNIPDSIPPAAPKLKSAICDSLGIVKLTWTHENFADIEQINIYTANYEHEEFSRITNIDADSIYTDTISLRVLNSSVFYKLVVFDKIFNPSEWSNTIEVIRYDTIAPNSPQIVEISSENKGILLKWGCCSSLDLNRTELLRRKKSETTWQTLQTFLPGSAPYRSYTDTTVEKRQVYEYTLTAIDEFGLISQENKIFTKKALDNGIRPAIVNFSYDLNKKKHLVKLEWQYPYSGVKQFVVYKIIDNGTKFVVANIPRGTYEFFDNETGQGVNYRYQIKAEHIDGGKSPLSQEIHITY